MYHKAILTTQIECIHYIPQIHINKKIKAERLTERKVEELGPEISDKDTTLIVATGH